MKYTATLPLPGADRDVVLDLDNRRISDPYTPGATCPIGDAELTPEHLHITAMVGRTAFLFDGDACPEGYALTFTTHETIPLDPGTRLRGETGALAGEYLVGVYSPGGVKENHFVIEQTETGYTGEMYGLVDEKTLAFMQSMTAGGPGAMPPDAPPMEPKPLPKLGDKMDLNPFSSVTGSAGHFEVITFTGMGSEFRFAGSIHGDEIAMTLHVTDSHTGILAKAHNPNPG